jgi:hypothetical protein
MSRWNDDEKGWDKQFKIKKVYQTSRNMMFAIVGAAFIAGILVGFNFTF